MPVCASWSDITLSTQLLLLVFGRRSRAPTCSLVCARWSGLLAVAAQRAFAASLLELPPASASELGERPEPELHELLAEARWDHA